MTAPVINTAGQRLYTDITPLVEDDETYGWAALLLIAAIGAMAQDVDEIIEDTDAFPGWAVLLDPDTCPAAWLPWTAWLFGVTLIPNSDEQTIRDTIRGLPPQHRSTPAAIVAAAGLYLTGSQRVILTQRDGSAWRFSVTTYEAQTPDPAAVLAALLLQKPAGDVLNYTVAPGWTWSEMVAHYGPTTVWSGLPAEDWTTFSHHLPD